MNYRHTPVLLAETLMFLNATSQKRYLDGTVGGGGHLQAILEMSGPTGKVFGIDRDPIAIDRLKQKFLSFGERVTLAVGSFDAAPQLLGAHGWSMVDGILLDLGLSSLQLADQARGFSFELEGPLDLRFDQTDGQSASQWLATVREHDLADILFIFGELHSSRVLARRLIEFRRQQPLQTTADLVRASGLKTPQRLAQLFQAIRIATNDEFGTLTRALPKLWHLLQPGGRLVIISFQSLEDRLVKQAFRSWHQQGEGRLLARKPVRPTPQEIATNRRSRSAKLRVIEKNYRGVLKQLCS